MLSLWRLTVLSLRSLLPPKQQALQQHQAPVVAREQHGPAPVQGGDRAQGVLAGGEGWKKTKMEELFFFFAVD